MTCFGEYSLIETMELRVENRTKADSSGESVNVATNGYAPAPSLLGAACQEFKIPIDSRFALYTKDNVMLSRYKTLASYGLKSGDTVYLKPKGEADDLLFLLNWRVLAIGFLLLSCVGLILVAAIYVTTAGRAPFIYGVVVDAGSSHSEATLYYWNGNKYYGTGKAEEVAHVETDKAGISSLQPREAQHSIADLLEKVKAHIPAHEIRRTPVFLAATAGMRLLNITSPQRADTVFLATETAIKGSGMAFGGAGILSGQDEGLSAWLSANYLLERLPRDQSDPNALVGAMDCGGASTQIAFEVDSERQHREFRRLKLFGHQYNVFSRSYLCYGINEAFNRYIMILLRDQKYETDTPIESPCHNLGFDGNIALSSIITPCTSHKGMPEELRTKNLTDLRIVGTGKPLWCNLRVNNLFGGKECEAMAFKECFNEVPVPIPDIHFAALSGFTYNMQQMRFNGSTMTAYKAATDNFCSLDYDTMKQEYYSAATAKYASTACFKANYIYQLLTNYNVSDSNFAKIHFRKEAKGYNLGWSLGYMINATNAIPEAEPYPALIPTPWFITFLILFAVILTVGLFALFISMKRSRRTRTFDGDKNHLSMKETAA